MTHPTGPTCTLCDSVALAEVEGSYLCVEHAIEAMEQAAGTPVEETLTAPM